MKKKYFLIVFGFFLLIFAYAAYVQISLKLKDRLPNPSVSLSFDFNNYPKVDGSTSARPLQRFIACSILNIKCYRHADSWEGVKYVKARKSSTTQAINFINQLNHAGTHGSYENLINKQADLILVARLPSQDELNLAQQQNAKLEPQAVALDAFVFIANRESPITSLTVQQIKDIYTGKITNWSAVGGPDKKINAYQRNPNSGSQELMETLVMKDLTMIDAPYMTLSGMMGPINMLSSDKLGISYSVYYFEQYMADNKDLKLLKVNHILPDSQTIKSKQYPFTTEVFAVTRSDLNPASNTAKLKQWLLSPEGQSVIALSGYVPIQ